MLIILAKIAFKAVIVGVPLLVTAVSKKRVKKANKAQFQCQGCTGWFRKNV